MKLRVKNSEGVIFLVEFKGSCLKLLSRSEAICLILKTKLICPPIRKREILFRIYVAKATATKNSWSIRDQWVSCKLGE